MIFQAAIFVEYDEKVYFPNVSVHVVTLKVS